MKYKVDKKLLEPYHGSRKTRYKEQAKKLAENPDFIPGIYNYCDRWCERCPFTSRCMTFALSEEQFGDLEAVDINNAAFWERLTETFEATLEMIKETAEEQGIDLDAIDTTAIEQEEKQIWETAENHEICHAAEAYGERVNQWFDSMSDSEGRIEMPYVETSEDETALKDAVEVIRWYQHQIYVKLMRAVTGDLEETPAILEGFPKDSDGSAKVALIGIDRSMSAWDQLLKYFPEQEDNALNLLFHLVRLRRNVEKAFPDAIAFVRPGFDAIFPNG